MILAFSFGFATRHPGLLLVLLGVVGEVFFDWPEMTGKRAFGKKLSALVLVVGLVMEFAEAAKSDREVASMNERTALIESNNLALSLRVEGLNKQAADARVVAGNAEKDASQANERAAKFDADRVTIAKQAEEIRGTNFVLQAKLLELEAKNQDRTITIEQIIKFMASLGNSPRGSVMIGVRHPDSETRRFFNKIAGLLQSVGFSFESDINYPDNIVQLNENSSIGILIDSLNDAPPYATNLFNAFNLAGINATLRTNETFRTYSPTEGHPGSNEVLILVGEKP
jgi:hypothetical protein